MALTYSKHLFLKILHSNSQKLCFPFLGSKHQFVVSVVQCSSDSAVSGKGISRAMKAYLERAQEHDKFMQEQLEEFNIGKKHLANMMGKKEEEMNQEEINKAIDYLFPSGLTVKSARPVMKPPNEIFTVRKAAEFDYTGRPFHFLFYTSKPNFSQLLHDAAKHLQELNQYEVNEIAAGKNTTDKTLTLTSGRWFTKEDLENKLIEKIYTIDYNKFVEVFDRLAAHPYNYLVESFIRSYRKHTVKNLESKGLKPIANKDGTFCVNISGACRKTSRANVTVRYPGEGLIKINGVGIDYFVNMQSREQVNMLQDHVGYVKI